MPKLNNRGIAPLLIIIAVVLLAAGAAAVYKYSSSGSIAPTPSPSGQPSPMPSVMASPSATIKPQVTPKPTTAAKLIDCIGPDGKHSQKTQADCDSFKKAWATPTPKPTASPSTSSSTSSGGCEIGQANIGVSADNGPVVGDALITVKVTSSSCASTYDNYKVLSQGSSSANFSGILPGSYQIKVLYHGREFNDSFDMSNAGNVSKTVSVTN